MSLGVSPKSNIDMVIGEEYTFTLALFRELKTKTVSSYTYKVYDSSDTEVTVAMGGGSVIDDSNVILFGIIAAVVGDYTLKFVVTCDNLLPNASTPYEFIVIMELNVE